MFCWRVAENTFIPLPLLLNVFEYFGKTLIELSCCVKNKNLTKIPMLYLENERLSQEGTYYVVNCDSCIMKSNCMQKKKKKGDAY